MAMVIMKPRTDRLVDDAGYQRSRFGLEHTFLQVYSYPARRRPYQLVDLHGMGQQLTVR